MQLKFGNRVIKTCRLLKEHIFLYILQFLVLLFVLAMQCVQESLTFIPVPFASEALNIDVRVVRGRQLLYTATNLGRLHRDSDGPAARRLRRGRELPRARRGAGRGGGECAAGRAGAAPGTGTERRLWRLCGGPREAQNGWLKVGKFLGAPLVLNSLTIIIHSSYNSDLVRF